MVVRAGSREAAEENYAKAISAAGFKPRPDRDARKTPSDSA
jgi:hypothetical protein